MLTYGTDVSSNNTIEQVNPAGTEFTIVKATEGLNYVNPVMGDQVARAREAGRVVGWYHLLWPGNIVGQINHFLSTIDAQPGDLLAVDWEVTTSGTLATCAEKDQALAQLKGARPSHRVLLYCDRYRWLRVDTTSDCGDGLWIADYAAPAGAPGIQHPWTIHQYSASGGLDHDAYNGSLLQLKSWAAGAPTPKPGPAPKPSPAPKPTVYIVREGDTLSSIAEEHGVTLAALEAANHLIPNPNYIVPGWRITIP